MNDDMTFPPLQPDDPNEQLLYLRRLQWRYPDETAVVEEAHLLEIVRNGLRLCPELNILDPTEVVRFLALSFLITPEQRNSPLLAAVLQRVLMASGIWGAHKRLNFIYKHVVGRPPPNPEPDFGEWFVLTPHFLNSLSDRPGQNGATP